MKHNLQFRSKTQADDAWITAISTKLWGSPEIISRDDTYDLLKIPNFIAVYDRSPVGFIMYVEKGKTCEIVALYCKITNQGIGTKLIDRVKDIAKKDGCSKAWLMTTNDNTAALCFYQKRGFVITGIRTNVIEEQRKIKPIPMLGNDGIPIRDEIELEIEL
ncbi:GNAT family N-acetyltransferase [Candidatus Gottesmanbacteria bacterium]|nr:GNAT family N-acetyltransferase [Candidatus Gottesmanbacteria bacterium]